MSGITSTPWVETFACLYNERVELAAVGRLCANKVDSRVLCNKAIINFRNENEKFEQSKTKDSESESQLYLYPSYRLHSKWAVLLLSLISHENISTSCCDTRVSCFELDFMLGSTNHLSPRLRSLSPFQLFIDRLKISHWIWRYWFPFDTHFEQFHLFAHALMWLEQRRSTWAVHYYLFNDTTAAWGVFSSTSRDARDSKNTAPLSKEVKSEDFSLSFYFILLRIHFSSFFMFHFPSKLSDAVECALLHSSFSTANRTGEELSKFISHSVSFDDDAMDELHASLAFRGWAPFLTAAKLVDGEKCFLLFLFSLWLFYRLSCVLFKLTEETRRDDDK